MIRSKLARYLGRFLPEGVIKAVLKIRKQARKIRMKLERIDGGFSQDTLLEDLKTIGIREGDDVLVHSSLSKIGYIQGGANTLIKAILRAIGPSGTLLMPSFPAEGRNKDYLETKPEFSIRDTPSAMGLISETFRTMPGVLRSLHPTDAVCAYGPKASWYVSGHFGQPTPYTAESPFGRLADAGGKILMIGTSLNGACTSLHVVEDAINFPYPVYDAKTFDTVLIDEFGKRHRMTTRVHNPEWSAKRDADLLLPLLLRAGIIHRHSIGRAASMLIEAKGLRDTLIHACQEDGITMYTPMGKQ
jgi:aminoglycoside 3-N-acetyltransferase